MNLVLSPCILEVCHFEIQFTQYIIQNATGLYLPHPGVMLIQCVPIITILLIHVCPHCLTQYVDLDCPH